MLNAVLWWFASYLSDHCQSVIFDGIVSVPSPLVYRVPQGSVFSLVLPASVGCNFCSQLRFS